MEAYLVGSAFCLGLGGLCCAIAVAAKYDGENDGTPLVFIVFALIGFGLGAYGLDAAGDISSQAAGCPRFDSRAGLDSNTPYQTLSTAKIAGKIYSFVRLVNAGQQPIRCIMTDSELPPVFSVGENGIIALSKTPMKLEAPPVDTAEQ